MEVKILYKYNRENGGVTVSPQKPNCEYTEMYRLIADDGMELVKGDIRTVCVDADTTDGWVETEAIDLEYLGREYKETNEPIEPIEEPNEEI